MLQQRVIVIRKFSLEPDSIALMSNMVSKEKKLIVDDQTSNLAPSLGGALVGFEGIHHHTCLRTGKTITMNYDVINLLQEHSIHCSANRSFSQGSKVFLCSR